MINEHYDPLRTSSSRELRLAKQRPGFKAAWEALDEEYAALDALLAARQEAGLTQEALAELMGTTKSAISRLESSFRNDRHSPSFATLKRYAHACGKKLLVQLV
jgi:DNA-binding XRE family transcriptional regulator